jgi:hypothetical protein
MLPLALDLFFEAALAVELAALVADGSVLLEFLIIAAPEVAAALNKLELVVEGEKSFSASSVSTTEPLASSSKKIYE